MMMWKNESAWIEVTLSGDKVKAFMTPREGGVSSGPYGNLDGIMGLNVGDHVGDHPSCVSMNRKVVEDAIGAPLLWLNQVHGNEVVTAPVPVGTAADAIISTIPTVACAVMVADCLPILVKNQSGTVVAAIHGGWKPLALGIVDKTIRQLQALTQEPLCAWVGPGISQDAFEVGPEVVSFLDAALRGQPVASFDAAWTPLSTLPSWAKAGSGDRAFVNLPQVARLLLENASVTDIYVSSLTTSDATQFYSYRRDGQKTGRHVAVIRANG